MDGSCFQSLFRNAFDNVPDLPPATCVYHEPPPAGAAVVDYYSANPSVFGRILNGESPSRDYAETSELLAFRDRSPKAEFHALVIPKRYVPNLYSLTNDDLDLVRDMRRMALDLPCAPRARREQLRPLLPRPALQQRRSSAPARAGSHVGDGMDTPIREV